MGNSGPTGGELAAMTVVGVGWVSGGVEVGVASVAGAVGDSCGAASGGVAPLSKRKTPSPSVAAYRCWPSEDMARALTSRRRNPALIDVHVAPASVER